jgi:hypothetical protein
MPGQRAMLCGLELNRDVCPQCRRSCYLSWKNIYSSLLEAEANLNRIFRNVQKADYLTLDFSLLKATSNLRVFDVEC